MNTPSHVLITAALRRALPRLRMPLGAVLAGAAAPDVPLFALVGGGMAYFCGVLHWPTGQALDWMLRTLYLHDPFWLGARSLLHAPLVLAALGAIAYAGRGHRAARWLGWFAAACALHSLLDIMTHVADGPLVLFPFDWTTRIRGPVSYWDPRFHGRAFAMFEIALDVVLLIYLMVGPAARWRTRRMFAATDAPR